MPPHAQSPVEPNRFAFFGTEPVDFSPVPDITLFQGLSSTVAEIKRMAKKSVYMRDAWNDFLELYVDILQQQKVHKYVSATWAQKLHSVVTELHQFARQNENTHWFVLAMNFMSLEKQLNELKHQFRALRIGMTFHTKA